MGKERDAKDYMLKSLGLFLVVASLVALVWGWSIYHKTTESAGNYTITVSAEGKTIVKPDLALVYFSVVSQGSDSETVQTDNDAKMTEAINYLKGQGIDEADIKTISYNLNPQYDYKWCDSLSSVTPSAYYTPCTAKLSGYIMTQSVELKLRDLSKIGEIIGNLPDKGINEISSISFTVDDEDAPKIEARKQALEKATAKAMAMADAANVKLGKVLNISENNGYYATYSAKEMSVSGASSDYSTIQTGSNEITVTVSITYAIK